MHHPEWRPGLAAGYAEARTAQDAGDVDEPLPAWDARLLRENAVVIAAGQLSEWVLEDLQDGASRVSG